MNEITQTGRLYETCERRGRDLFVEGNSTLKSVSSVGATCL